MLFENCKVPYTPLCCRQYCKNSIVFIFSYIPCFSNTDDSDEFKNPSQNIGGFSSNLTVMQRIMLRFPAILPLVAACSPYKAVNQVFSTSSKMPTVYSGENLVIKFTRVTTDAFPPTKGSKKAAGYDLKSAEDYVLEAHGKGIIDTGIKVQLPPNCYGRIAPRSGLAAKNFIDVGGKIPTCTHYSIFN